MHSLLLLAGLLAGAGPAPEGVRGRVVDGDGRPVPGALVVLSRSAWWEDADREQATRSDADGRFALADWRDDGGDWFVLAHKAGLALGAAPILDPEARYRFPRDEPPPRELTVRLVPPARARLRLEGPDGRPPDAGAGVSLVRFGPTQERGTDGELSLVFRAAVPRALADSLGLRLQGDGTLALDCLPPHSSYGLQVAGPGLGTQRADYLTLKPGTEQLLRLAPVGGLSGRVVAGDPEAAARLTVRVETRSLPPARDRAGGHATVVTDAEGRFEVRELAAGQATLFVRVRNGQGWLPPVTVNAVVKPGETAAATIELTRGVHVQGRVSAEGSGQGIAGVRLVLGDERVVSDERGEFQAYTRPGRIAVSVVRVPLPWLSPLQGYRGEVVPAGSKTHQLAPIKLKQGFPLTGVVVDEAGRPVAGARVTAVWRKSEGTLSTLGSDTAVSEADGRFMLQRVPGDVELGLAAQTDRRATVAPARVPPPQRQPVRLAVRPEGVVTIEGRVLDPDGRAVPGARVQLSRAVRLPTGEEYGQAAVPFGDEPLRADAEGVFRTPAGVARREQYTLTAEAPGMVKYESRYVTPSGEGERFRWPDVVLQRERTAAGAVVAPDGRPVSGAAVWSHGPRLGQRVTAQTDAAGRFRLTQLHPTARLVFAQKDGYRPAGGTIPAAGEARILLTPEGGSAPDPLRSVRRSREERGRLLKDLVTPILPRLREVGSDFFTEEALKRLAPYDREFVLGRLDQLRTDGSRADVLAALGSLDDAQEFAALVKDPYSRAYGFLTIADAAAPARRRQVLAEALVHARAVEQPDRRVVVLANVAGRLLGLGDRAAALKVLEEGRPIAAELAPTEWSGFARGHFAATLALVDSAAALALIKDFKDDELTRHAGNIAHKLAGVKPAEAEHALALVKDDRYVTPCAVRVCYRMARADLPRARRIADGLAPEDRTRGATQKAQAYGVMAMALAEAEPATARDLLRRAFDHLAPPGPQNWYYAQSAFPVAAVLLGYSETVDPERTRDYFWRVLALHPGPVAESWSPRERTQRDHENAAQLVLLLALYGQFPELQKELLEPVFRYWSGYTNRKEYDFSRQNAVFTAMALADPRRAIAWHTEFHPKVDKEDRRLIPQPWMTLADVFGHEGPELQQRLTEQVFHLWVIDKEDL